MPPSRTKRQKTSAETTSERATETKTTTRDGTDASRGKMMTTGTETGGGDSKASSEATTMRVNADAEQSYDDLTGAALTGIEAHAIEAEAELKTARERAASAQTTPTKEGGGEGAGEPTRGVAPRGRL